MKRIFFLIVFLMYCQSAFASTQKVRLVDSADNAFATSTNPIVVKGA